MANIAEQQIVIKMSKLVKGEKNNLGPFLSDDIKASLEQVVEQLVDDNTVVVEVSLTDTETVYSEG